MMIACITFYFETRKSSHLIYFFLQKNNKCTTKCTFSDEKNHFQNCYRIKRRTTVTMLPQPSFIIAGPRSYWRGRPGLPSRGHSTAAKLGVSLPRLQRFELDFPSGIFPTPHPWAEQHERGEQCKKFQFSNFFSNSALYFFTIQVHFQNIFKIFSREKANIILTCLHIIFDK